MVCIKENYLERNLKMKNKLKYLWGLLVLVVGLLFGTQGFGLQETNVTEALPAQKQQAQADAEHTAQQASTDTATIEEISEASENKISESGSYTSKDEVALYLHTYQHLPENFITKKEAKELGWDNNEGNLAEVAAGKSIGGDYFGNYEGILPEQENRNYYECDIDSDGGHRGAKRIVFSNDGLIYYTEDHYESFELLYGEE